MDSDDEYILEREARTRSKYHDFAQTRRHIGSSPVRLFEEQENSLLDAWTAAGKELSDASNDPPSEHGLQYRVLRFCSTMKGFHTGSLDFAGRHEHRYQSIQRRWKEFAPELEELLEHTMETKVPILDPLGQVVILPGDPPSPLMDVSFNVNADDLCRAFEQKWQLKLYSISAMKLLFEDVKACLNTNPEPKLQKLCILDLPPELLHLIMAVCRGDIARQLGMTCRKLRLASLPFIYQERTLELKLKPDWVEVPSRHAAPVHEYVRSLAMTARDKFTHEIAFLKTRPDITNCIEKLSIIGWTYRDFEKAGWHMFDEHVVEYLAPISAYVHDLIACSPNIKRLHLYYMVVTQAMQESIFNLPRLELLRIASCKATGSVNSHYPICSGARNLHLVIDGLLDASSWTLMPGLPNVRWLTLHGSNEARLLPSADLITQRNPFVTMERAFINGLQPDEWNDLVSVFSSASIAANHRLPLTHLKVSFTYGIPDFTFRGLLAALEGSALECLVLDGIAYGDPALIDGIAEKLPGLKSLTLAHRDGTRQSRNRAVRWPRPTWEYAQRLGRFRRLAHFGWNLDVAPTPLPAVITHFENGYPDDWWEHVRDDWLDPSDHVARLLAAYCSTLETVVFLDFIPVRYFSIIRSPEGTIQTDARFQGPYFETHNPNVATLWPIISHSDDA